MDATINKINDETSLLLVNNRVFFQSTNLDIFPCSRRGNLRNYYDPEARLNTEHTNRLHTAINGIDQFIVSFKDADGNDIQSVADQSVTGTGTLTFVLAGYRVEVRNFNPSEVASSLGSNINKIYAHLSLHDGISLNVEGYSTEILYRQSTKTNDINSLDVLYEDATDTTLTDDFFVGISFTPEMADDEISETGSFGSVVQRTLPKRNLQIFYKNDDGSWELEQTSLLPNITHGQAEDSIVVKGAAEFSGIVNITDRLYSTAANIDSITVLGSSGEVGTEINSSGIQTSYINAKSLAAEGLSIGNEINIVDNPDSPTKQTTVGLDITTTGTITAQTALKVQSGNIENPAIAEIDKASITKLSVTGSTTLQGQVTIDNTVTADNLTINTEGSVNTPTLNVDTITSKSDSDDAIITVQKSLKVEDNINVGTPTTPATTNNSGCIVAQYDITAEEDLIAKRDISAGGSAAIAGNLTVGTDNNTDAGTINAKKLVKAPILEATAEAKIPLLTVTNKADITNTLNVHNTNNAAKITADKVQIDKDLIVYDTITATKDLGATKNNLNVNKASITTLSSTTAAIGTINSDDINQKIGDSYYDVPVIFVQQQDSADSNKYQLQIRRATVLPYKNN